MNAKDAWKCKFPGCPRYSDETYCFSCEKAIAAAKKASPVTVALMADTLRRISKAEMVRIDRLIAADAGAAVQAYDKETKT